ncbi:hypothetical protein Tco_0355152 [Tanacetum coccineum]
MPIPKDLITDVIHNSEYYQKYLDMAASKPRQATTVIDEEGGKKKKASPAGKSKKPAPAKQPASAKQPKPVKKKPYKPTPSRKIHKGNRSDHLVDEEDKEPQPASKPQVEDDEYNLQRGIQMSLESFQAPVDGVVIREPDSGIIRKLPEVEGKGKGIVSDEQAAQSLLDLQKPKSKNAETGADTEKSTSKADTEIFNNDEEHGEEVSHTVALVERTVELDEGQAGSDPGKTPESQPLPERVLIEEDQARSNPGQSHMLEASMEEHIYIENPPSSSRTLSSMKNLDDAFTFGDQFLNDKSPEDEPEKTKVETDVESMVNVPIYQASSSAPLLSTPIIDLTPPKPVSPLICANFEKKNKLQDKTTQALSSRVCTLKNHDLYLKIDKYINEVVKEAVYNALQALIHKRFRDLTEFEMKEILHDRMFESGSYRSHPEHTTLYEVMEASMDRENREEFNEEMAKSRKRRRDDQDPPPPPPKDFDRSKKKKHDSDASASK